MLTACCALACCLTVSTLRTNSLGEVASLNQRLQNIAVRAIKAALWKQIHQLKKCQDNYCQNFKSLAVNSIRVIRFNPQV